MKININILCIFEVARLLEKVTSIRQKEARLFQKEARLFRKEARFPTKCEINSKTAQLSESQAPKKKRGNQHG